ncbi:envelope glycoprotein 42 [Vespertilionid gammaherpesvirus 1]|uniref:Envelope glycoprotein 42 n=1 Tax=Vespertilionid gammaherpesvirus 1 TaxID=2560830 RepID=A0A109QA91_9GAMA|nr:envelope glycoprotein 42 [Myotis gammaherpesvirus 8]AMA67406.1 envelope glycoprotein 42 [Vespertilionid gammaherpesvirus 1]
MAEHISVYKIVLLISSLTIAITCMTLSVSSIVTLYTSGVTLGTFIMTHHQEIGAVYEKPEEIDWDNVAFTKLSERHYMPSRHRTPKLYTNVEKYKAKCSNCSRETATIALPNRCFSFTKEKHNFMECFEVCQKQNQCYQFANPGNDIEFIRGVMNDSTTYWVGIFKTGSSNEWTDLKGYTNITVHDIFNSYCAYIGRYTEIPWSAYFCDSPRPCLCGGSVSITTYNPPTVTGHQ